MLIAANGLRCYTYKCVGDSCDDYGEAEETDCGPDVYYCFKFHLRNATNYNDHSCANHYQDIYGNPIIEGAGPCMYICHLSYCCLWTAIETFRDEQSRGLRLRFW